MAGHKICIGLTDWKHHKIDFAEDAIYFAIAILASEALLSYSIGTSIIDFLDKTFNKMKIIDIILTSLYDHFCRMQKRGRKINPWFQTCSSLAFITMIPFTLLLKIIFNKSLDFKQIPEYYFIFLFLTFGICVFFLVKGYYFKNNKHIKLMETYIKKYSEATRNKIRYTVTVGLTLLPFVFMIIMWLQESHLFWQGF